MLNPMYLEQDPVIRRVIACYISRQPLFLWGPPGTAKTDRVHQAGLIISQHPEWWPSANEKTTWEGVTVRRLAQMVDATEFIGMPDIEANGDDKGNPNSRYTVWRHPKALPRKGAGLFFLDEMTLADQSLMAVSYQLIDSYKISLCGYDLPASHSIIAAGNREEDGVPVFAMGKALERRFSHYEVDIPTREQWVNWALNSGEIVPEIVAFLMWARWDEHAYRFDPKEVSKAWPSFPSWHRTSKMITANKATDSDIMGEFAVMNVGKASGYAFQMFVKLQHEVTDPTKVISDPSNVALPGIARMDLRWALCSSVASYVADRITTIFQDNAKAREKELLEEIRAKYIKPLLIVSKRLGEEMGILMLRMVKGASKPVRAFNDAMSLEPMWRGDMGKMDKWGKFLQ